MAHPLSGTGVALATPMKEDLSIDYESLEKLVDHVISNGVDYLVVMGTTGESPTCTWDEKKQVLTQVLSLTNNKVPVVFGLGGNNTSELIQKSAELASTDIDAILSVSPFYNRPSQEGIYQHYKLLADASPKPIILYNVPSRTASNVVAYTTLRLAEHQNIIGMKEASGDLTQCDQILENKPADFLLLSGDDQITLELMKKGAEGVISVIANILPTEFTQMVNLAFDDNYNEAHIIDSKLQKAYDLLAKEGNPTSLKAGLSVCGLSQDTVRPPLFQGSDDLHNQWKEYLKQA